MRSHVLAHPVRWTGILLGPGVARDWVHVKDMKNLVEVQLPGGDRFLTALCVMTSRDRVPFTPLDDVPLDLVRGPD